jgi:hypothetical protein
VARINRLHCLAPLLWTASVAAQQPPEREDLAIPVEVWADALKAVSAPGPALGYSSETMRAYRFDTHLLRSVETLFRDVRAVPRYTGKVSDDMLAAADDPAKLVWLGYTLTDISAGRDFKAPELQRAGEPIDWGVQWLPKGASPHEAAAAAIKLMGEPPHAERPLPERFGQMPPELQRLIARLLVSITESQPYIRKALPKSAYSDATQGVEGDSHSIAYAIATSPWIDERDAHFVSGHAGGYSLLAQFDRQWMAFGSVVFAAYASAGVREYLAWEGRHGLPEQLRAAGFEQIAIDTGLGKVYILGPEDDSFGDALPLMVVDAGGNDTYGGNLAVSSPMANTVGLLVDLAGDDQYSGEQGTMGCGLFGVGAIFDLGGKDTYSVRRSGLAAGHFGTGLVYDFEGDDTYEVKDRFGIAAGIGGLGLLVDRAGNDTYTCGSYSEGLGGTLGAGVLLDVEGNDTYIARDDGNISELYLNQSVAMSQGCGWGRRADFGDGHSLAGGVGALIDGAGDDSYHSQVWSQGCGYWWALGFLEDRAGNDTYRNGKYSAGAAAHFAIGSCVDLAGDDKHNLSNDTAKNQFNGHARDGSLAVFFDADGDDAYMLRDHCGGSGDLGSVAVFWDRRGDDVYTLMPSPDIKPKEGWDDARALGSSTWYEPMRTFRDDISTYGLFFDTGGSDRYELPEWPGGGQGHEGAARPGENARWRYFRPWGFWGYGIDLDRP